MAAQTYIGGVEVTDIVLEGSATRRLNRPAQATVRVPITDAIGDVGDRMKVVLDGDLFFHGTILMIEDEGDEDFGYTTYNASDPFELWQWRPCRDSSVFPPGGNLIDPDFIKVAPGEGPEMIRQIIFGSEEYEGILYIDIGSFAAGGVDLRGASVSWPMTMAEFTNLLTSTGEVDIVFTPIDAGGNMAQVDVYNGNYGTDRSGSVFFDYATGNYNVRRVRQSVDMSTLVNKLVYELGPKQTTRRYRANLTGDLVPGCWQDGVNWTHAQVLAKRNASQGTYGVRMEIQELDTDELVVEDPANGECDDPARILYRRLWQLETWIRAEPRRLVHVTPVRGAAALGTFDIGDLVTVRAGAVFRGGFSGAQRVYEYTVNWDEDGVYELSELQTSADQG